MLNFHTGGTYVIKDPNVSAIASGFLTAGKTRAWFMLPLGRPVVTETSAVTINNLYGAIRTVNGALITGGGMDWATKVVSAYLKGSNLVMTIDVSNLSNLPNNNTPLALSVESSTGLNFTLN